MNKELKTIFKKIGKLVDPAIEKILLASTMKKHQPAFKYQIGVGGKRLRPVLAVLSCKMLGGKFKDVLYSAAALEILHNYTLIVDDIIDHSEFRRGKPTVWKNYGSGMAECISVNYAASIFDLPVFIKDKERIYSILARVLKEITDGEILDILFEQSGREEEKFVVKNRYAQISIKNYFELARKKTASLLGASCEVGGICARGNEKRLDLLRSFGLDLGVAYQIQDDILDIFGDAKKFGKKIGKDIAERKLGNIVVLFAMREFNLEDKQVFLKILRKKKIENSDIKKAIALIKKTKAREKAGELGLKFIARAKSNLTKLPKNRWNDDMRNLADYLVSRKV